MKTVKGKPLSEDDKFWITYIRDTTISSIDAIQEAAKQLISTLTVLNGIYVSVLAFSGMKEMPKGNLLAAVFYGLPILCFLLSLFFIINVFRTRAYKYQSDDLESIRKVPRIVAEHKQNNLTAAYICLCIGLFIAILGIGYWLYLGSQGNVPTETLPFSKAI